METFREFNKEVYYATDRIIKLNKEDIQLFKEKASNNQRKTSRLCTHKNVNDNLHEMFIVFTKGAYVRPHKHPNKSISYHIVEGSADIVVFDEEGNIVDVVQMSDYSSGKKFYHRIFDPYYYTPILRSDFLVFHEITNGPFKESDTVFAPWAPDENDSNAIKEFMEKLDKDIDRFLSQHNKG